MNPPPYADWLASKPDPAAVGDGVRELEKLARYVRDLLPLANNFVAFRDFYTRQGRDWNATITRMVEHPISLRQAFWSPYKQVARLVAGQVQKMAVGKAKDSDDKLGALALGATKKAITAGEVASKAPVAAALPPFDVGKFAGIFAAIGLAVGALGTALVSMLSGLLSLKWWQVPIAFLGLLLIVSGPAVLLAWFKLRSRNLGPILDANGWAINARARINIPFGTSLTQLAQLPPNAERSLKDPYAEKNNRGRCMWACWCWPAWACILH